MTNSLSTGSGDRRRRPLGDGTRAIEIGCGPGAMASELAARVGDGHVLAIDRSEQAVAVATAASRAEVAAGRLSLRHTPSRPWSCNRERRCITSPWRSASASSTAVPRRWRVRRCTASPGLCSRAGSSSSTAATRCGRGRCRDGGRGHRGWGWRRTRRTGGSGRTGRGPGGDRPLGTAIWFLLREDERSHWCRVDADDSMAVARRDAAGPVDGRNGGGACEGLHARPRSRRGRPAPPGRFAGRWQAARPVGGWTLVSCLVAPGFAFELAPPAFDIPR